MQPDLIQILGTVLFAIAIVHTFSANLINRYAARFPEGSKRENLFHLLGEVEVVFGFWAGIFILLYSIMGISGAATEYMDGLNFTEPLFVFVIMAAAATRPMIEICERTLLAASHLLPVPKHLRFFVVAMALGPLLGSFITEPAAMTLIALILKHRYYDQGISRRFQYIVLGTLFVNVSIGGVLTSFAAPPVVMVASTWNWDVSFMMTHFGWKAVIAVLINTKIATVLLFKELKKVEDSFGKKEMPKDTEHRGMPKVPMWLTGVHILFLILIVVFAHHPKVFVGIFLFFMGITYITQEFQDEIKLRESLLVGFFLGGLVVLGGVQSWWLKPLLASMGEMPIFIGSTLLTAFTDNAALTYLGAQVESISDPLKYYLVAGAVSGGGLSVIANAPNPAGLAILRDRLEEQGGFSPLKLMVAAAIPTVVAMLCFGLLPSL